MLLTEPFRTMFYHFMRTTCLAVLLSLVVTVAAAELPEGVRRIKVLNFPDCFELSNAETRVTLCHQVGGRVAGDKARGALEPQLRCFIHTGFSGVPNQRRKSEGATIGIPPACFNLSKWLLSPVTR